MLPAKIGDVSLYVSGQPSLYVEDVEQEDGTMVVGSQRWLPIVVICATPAQWDGVLANPCELRIGDQMYELYDAVYDDMVLRYSKAVLTGVVTDKPFGDVAE